MHVKGVSFVNKPLRKGCLFCRKRYIKGLGVGPLSRASLYKTPSELPRSSLLLHKVGLMSGYMEEVVKYNVIIQF